MEYLNHLVTPGGLKTNPKVVRVVKDFPCPKNVKEVCHFLGLASYYRRFVPGFSSIARPLHELTHKDAHLKWSEQCQKAFTLLKEKLTSAPVLVYPSFNKPFTLETDASISGLGAVLSQVQDDGKLHPIVYASRSLSPAEQNYSVTELRVLGSGVGIDPFSLLCIRSEHDNTYRPRSCESGARDI